jgi:glyoxylase-like metal-dependent hydrolase (beta-lactamase superfamily II)
MVMDHLCGLLGHDLGGRRIVVFNSHMDWDHVWGNCFFGCNSTGCDIVSHRLCRESLSDDRIWNHMAEQNRECMNGSVQRILPNVTFDECLEFADEGVRFFHSPGHTSDSASCLDQVDNVLFAGDNLEAPLPCLAWHCLDEYLSTLEIYSDIQADIVIGAHNGVMNSEQIQSCEDYILELFRDEELVFTDRKMEETHKGNLRRIFASDMEDKAPSVLGPNFSMDSLHLALQANWNRSFPEFRKAMEKWLKSS